VKVLVVTATRGLSAYWPLTARSVRAAVPSARHVVVCPPDRVVEVGQVGDVQLIAQNRPGLYPKLNQGWREAGGDWDAFTWINDDDVLCAPGFGRVVEAMAGDSRIDFAYGRVDLIDGRGRRVCELPVASRAADLGDLLVQGIMPLAQPGTLIRRSAIEKLAGLDESFVITGDLDLFARAIAVGLRFQFVAAHAAEFRLNAGQLSKRSEEVAIETARSLQPLAGGKASRAARWRFRRDNAGVYLDRIRRHGFVSMRELYDRTT
jgi:Glycosyltransferase like family 2